MPNYELNNDWVVSIPIQTTDAAGTVVPNPAGDTFTAVSSNPASLNAVIGKMADGVTPALIMNALVQVSPGLTVTVTDSAGDAAFVQTVDIVDDVTPANVVLDLAGATHTAQPVPAAPGP